MGIELIPNIDVVQTRKPIEHLAIALDAVVEGTTPVSRLPIPDGVPLHYSNAALVSAITIIIQQGRKSVNI